MILSHYPSALGPHLSVSMVLGRKNPIGQALFLSSPHPSHNMLGKPDSEGWADPKLLYPSLIHHYYCYHWDLCLTMSPRSSSHPLEPCFYPGTGCCQLHGCGLALALPAPTLSTTCPNHLRHSHEGNTLAGNGLVLQTEPGGAERQCLGQGHGELFVRSI